MKKIYYDIFDFVDNDNSIISVNIGENVILETETWDSRKFGIMFTDCGKIELNSLPAFKIGRIEIIRGEDFNSEWEGEFISENPDYRKYFELIIRDPCNEEQINLRMIYSEYKLYENA